MDKRILSRLWLPLILFVLALLWVARVILMEYYPDQAGILSWYSLSWAATIFLMAAGLKYLLGGIFMHSDDVVVRRITIAAGALILILAVVCLTSAIALPHNIVAPLIAVIIAAAVFVAVFVTGGRRWDGGDNQRVGYKNYHQRKAEEEKQAAKAEKTDRKN